MVLITSRGDILLLPCGPIWTLDLKNLRFWGCFYKLASNEGDSFSG